MSIVGPCAVPFTHSETLRDLIDEADVEMNRLEEYVAERLWEASTEDIALRVAAQIKAAEQNI